MAFNNRTKRSPALSVKGKSPSSVQPPGQEVLISRIDHHNQHEPLVAVSSDDRSEVMSTDMNVTTIYNSTTPCPGLPFHGDTVWSRIGTGPLLTALAIVALILIYFIICSRDKRGEHFYLFVTILLSGFGNLGAGFVLSHVQNWKVFMTISQLLILEPTLLGLKGNIEMCMASRMATQANLGKNTFVKS